jgi:hypothetical protein
MTTFHGSTRVLFDMRQAQMNTCVPSRPSLVLLTRTPARCCSDLIGGRRIKYCTCCIVCICTCRLVCTFEIGQIHRIGCYPCCVETIHNA